MAYMAKVGGGELPIEELEAMDMEQLFERPEGEVQRLIAHLENSVTHLVRSNKELEEYMAETGNDKELRAAIGENIVIIARRRAILEDLQKSIAGGTPGTNAGAPAAAAAANKLVATVPVEDAPAAFDADGGMVL